MPRITWPRRSMAGAIGAEQVRPGRGLVDGDVAVEGVAVAPDRRSASAKRARRRAAPRPTAAARCVVNRRAEAGPGAA